MHGRVVGTLREKQAVRADVFDADFQSSRRAHAVAVKLDLKHHS